MSTNTPSQNCEIVHTALRVFQELKNNEISKAQAKILMEELGLTSLAATLNDPVKAA